MNYKAFVFCLIVSFFGCVSPQKSFEKGNYEKAYRAALKKVKKGKASSQERRIFMESFRKIVASNMEQINILEKSKNPNDLKQALKFINKTQTKINEIKRFTKTVVDENILELDDKKEEISEVLFQHFYNIGLFHLKQAERENRKQFAQEAFLNFEEAENYYNSPELDSLKKLALVRGIVHYTVYANAPFDITFNWEIDRVFDDIESFSDKFLDVQYGAFGFEADCQIEIEFRNIDIIQERRAVSQMEFQEEVVVRNETVRDTSGTRTIPVYGTVYATVTVTEFIKSAMTDVYIDVDSNSSDCDLTGTSFSRRVDAIVEQNEIVGDERAVPSQFRRYETIDDLPRDNELMEELFQAIYDEFTREYF